MRKTLLYLVLATVFMALCAACGSDSGYWYPGVKMEFLTASSGSDGAIKSIRTDEGVEYQVVQSNSSFKLSADTTARIVAYYEPSSAEGIQHGAKLYGIRQVFAALPVKAGPNADSIRCDPVRMQSIWLVKHYLNAVLEIKNQGGKHHFSFIEKSVVVDSAGRKTVEVVLSHDKGMDAEAYYDRLYLSVPLDAYLDQEVSTLIFCFTVNLEQEGWKTYRFSTQVK